MAARAGGRCRAGAGVSHTAQYSKRIRNQSLMCYCSILYPWLFVNVSRTRACIGHLTDAQDFKPELQCHDAFVMYVTESSTGYTNVCIGP